MATSSPRLLGPPPELRCMIYEYILSGYQLRLKTHMPPADWRTLTPAKLFMSPTALIATNSKLRREVQDMLPKYPPPPPQMLVGKPIKVTVLDMHFGNLILYAQFARSLRYFRWGPTPLLRLNITLVFRRFDVDGYQPRLERWLECCKSMGICATYHADTGNSQPLMFPAVWWGASLETSTRAYEGAKVRRALGLLLETLSQ
ncbi:hypothetical protein LTR78_007283 [Recurvomyces mirabilis]|uniref:Uncharacterized protein n=1 Tax=Recurvomyces mirabilis TaxID=574656 RepID=A0AAE1BYQ6_9PEZI|nr:hypothetical protein LTR78_007283 [Recurvomyces mirabilis]KAK5155475.1 hypothetical protein LTS14_005736 [Recurvomyces mirabilis]